MKSLRRVSKFCVCVIGLSLAACGPIFDTQYTFIPPDAPAGRTCIYQCENSQQQCRQLEDYRKEDCERRSEWDKERCEAEIWRKKGRDPKWYECGGESCSADYDSCDSSYRSCYQACGGQVRAETRCVANCDQLPAYQQTPQTGR